MSTTIITQPALRLITARSESFPDGNRAAFTALESHLPTLRGRKFYGLVYESGEGMEYHAGLLPANETEERKFAELGFPILEVPGGPCARRKLLDWTTRIDQIGPAFRSMIDHHGIDSSRPRMEFYRSLGELHLLLPIPNPDATS